MKTILRIVFHPLALFALFVAALCVDVAQAQTQVCAPGVDCVSNTFRTPAKPRYRFPACTSRRVGQIAFDGDGGVYRLCQYDGGWGQLGGAGGGDTLWALDAGELFNTAGDVIGIRVASSTSVQLAPNFVAITRGSTQADQITWDTNGFSIGGSSPVTAMPRSEFTYDGPASLEPAGSYAQAESWVEAEPGSDCIVTMHKDQEQGLVAWCRSTNSGDLEIFWFNAGAVTVAPCTSGCPASVRMVRP